MRFQKVFLPGLILFVGVFWVYLKTLCPTVAGGDSGELISVAATWGIAHPPGYPLYTLLAKVFTWIPMGSVAWRVNLFSAVCDAFTAVLIFHIVKRLTRRNFAGIAAAGIFSFSPLVWKYAVVAEVFALNNLLLGVLIYLFICYLDSPHRHRIYGMAFVAGLGLAHHHSFILIVLPLCCGFLFQAAKEIQNHKTARYSPSFRIPAVSLLFFLLGLTPYFYLPWASQFHTLNQWGNSSTLSGFLTHLFRREYGTWTLAANVLGTDFHPFSLLGLYLKEQTVLTLGLGPLLGILGGRILFRSGNRRLAILLGVTWSLYLIVFCTLSHLDSSEPLFAAIQNRFWQFPHLLISVLAGVGVAHTMKRFRPRTALLCVLIVLVVQIAWFWRDSDQSQNRSFMTFAESVLKALPPRSALLVTGDFVVNSFKYAQTVEGIRPDVPIVHVGLLAAEWSASLFEAHFPDLKFPKNQVYSPTGYTMKDWIQANWGHYNIFGCNGIAKPWDQSMKNAFYTWPDGLVERVLPPSVAPELQEWTRANRAFFQSYPIQELAGISSEAWEYRIYGLYWEMRQFFTERLKEYLSSVGASLKASPNVSQKIGYREAVKVWVEELRAVTESPWPSSAEKKQDLIQAMEILKTLE